MSARVLAFIALLAYPVGTLAGPPVVSPGAARARLEAGNRRFVAEDRQHPHESARWREGLEAAQRPFAAVVGCSDSRVPPELLFDQGFGDLFVIRVAGQVVGKDEAGSVEYAIEHLDTRLIVVLGHERCGAVHAALDRHRARARQEPRSEEPAEVRAILDRIAPALVGLEHTASADEADHLAVEANVRHAVARLRDTPAIAAAIETRAVEVVGAVYDLSTGRVRFLGAPGVVSGDAPRPLVGGAGSGSSRAGPRGG